MSDLGRLLLSHTDENGCVDASGIKCAIVALGFKLGDALFRAYMMGLEAF